MLKNSHRVCRHLLPSVMLAAAVTITAQAGRAGSLDPALAAQARTAMDRGARWLLARQSEAGSWSNNEFPALTGLPLWAILQSGNAPVDAVDRAVQFILASVHEDGSIWRTPSMTQKGGGLPNYNTAICMVALNLAGRPELVPVVQKARTYVASTQHFGGDMYSGGMGYDPDTGRPYADLSNSYMAYEAMRLTENVEDLRKDGDQPADLDWKAAQQFIERVQNRTESNDQPWASDDPDNVGGFAYKPDSSQAGTFTNEEGFVKFRSYGSMTYAGLLSFIYADVSKSDPRVLSAFDWAARHWTLDENPGVGDQGLYYYYNTLAKALAIYGQDLLPAPEGGDINWRAELIRKLVGLQQVEEGGDSGYWVNAANRWWEADPVLVTSYSIIALESALRGQAEPVETAGQEEGRK